MIKPDPSSRHPLVIFLLVLCVLGGAGILFQDVPAPGSIEASLPDWEVTVWAAALCLGGIITLAGVVMQGREARMRDGVLLEQYGVSLLGPAAAIYSVAAVAQVGLAAALPAGSVLALGVACVYRWFTLQRDVNRSKAVQAALEQHRNGASEDDSR